MCSEWLQRVPGRKLTSGRGGRKRGRWGVWVLTSLSGLPRGWRIRTCFFRPSEQEDSSRHPGLLHRPSVGSGPSSLELFPREGTMLQGPWVEAVQGAWGSA